MPWSVRIPVAAVLLVSAAVVPILGSAPAVAAPGPPDRAAFPAGTHPAPVTDACGTVLTPAEAAMYLGLLESLGPADLAGAPPPPYLIPIAAHIVRRSDGTGGLPEWRLADAIDDANFHYAGVDMSFYRLGEIDYIDSDEWYTTTTLAEIDAMRSHNLVADAVNIYFTENLDYESGGLCGISAFTFSSVQSIAMRNSCTANPDGLGNHSTFSHEVGHYFDLFHTHEPFYGDELVDGSNCDVAGDLVCDTPADPQLGGSNVSTACVYTGTATDPNGDLYVPDPSQLMSYSLKHCRDNFTSESLDRALATLVALRPNLITNPVAAPEIASGGPSPPDGFALQLAAPQPNPTRGAARFSFVIGRAGRADLSVYDVRGARVKTLANGELGAGRHEGSWDGVAESGRAVAAGLYFVRLRTAEGARAQKVQVVR